MPSIRFENLANFLQKEKRKKKTRPTPENCWSLDILLFTGFTVCGIRKAIELRYALSPHFEIENKQPKHTMYYIQQGESRRATVHDIAHMAFAYDGHAHILEMGRNDISLTLNAYKTNELFETVVKTKADPAERHSHKKAHRN